MLSPTDVSCKFYEEYYQTFFKKGNPQYGITLYVDSNNVVQYDYLNYLKKLDSLRYSSKELVSNLTNEFKKFNTNLVMFSQKGYGVEIGLDKSLFSNENNYNYDYMLRSDRIYSSMTKFTDEYAEVLLSEKYDDDLKPIHKVFLTKSQGKWKVANVVFSGGIDKSYCRSDKEVKENAPENITNPFTVVQRYRKLYYQLRYCKKAATFRFLNSPDTVIGHDFTVFLLLLKQSKLVTDSFVNTFKQSIVDCDSYVNTFPKRSRLTASPYMSRHSEEKTLRSCEKFRSLFEYPVLDLSIQHNKVNVISQNDKLAIVELIGCFRKRDPDNNISLIEYPFSKYLLIKKDGNWLIHESL